MNPMFDVYIESLLKGRIVSIAKSELDLFKSYVESKGLEQAFEHYQEEQEDEGDLLLISLADMVEERKEKFNKDEFTSEIVRILESYNATVSVNEHGISVEDDYIGNFDITFNEDKHIVYTILDTINMIDQDIEDFAETMKWINSKKRLYAV